MDVLTSVQTKICGYCGQRTTTPCGSDQQAQSCGIMDHALEEIANSVWHPARLGASVALYVYEPLVDVLAPHQ